MDEIDFKIVEILKQDARIPFTKIAKKLEVGVDLVIRRYKKLLRTGIIDKPTIVLNSSMCGFEGCADFFIKLKPGRSVSEINSRIGTIRNIVIISEVLGDVDIICSGFFTNYSDLAKMTEIIKAYEAVYTVDVSVYVDFEWPLPFSFLEFM